MQKTYWTEYKCNQNNIVKEDPKKFPTQSMPHIKWTKAIHRMEEDNCNTCN